jgi:hypothetical protein
MPFTTDTTWPDGLLKIFKICRNEDQPLVNRYYGPYNMLLAHCFDPNSFKFFHALQSPPRNSVELLPFFTIFNTQHHPVLIVEIADDSWATEADLRVKADDQMRQKYNSTFNDCPLPRLWGLSLLGTSLRVYSGDVATGDIEPAFQDRPNPGGILPRDFLEGAWDIDILTQEGFDKTKEIVGDIVGNATVL